MESYKIIRFRREGANETVATGLTLEEAQAHCQRDDTRGDGWFDGYDLEIPEAPGAGRETLLAENRASEDRLRNTIDHLRRLGI